MILLNKVSNALAASAFLALSFATTATAQFAAPPVVAPSPTLVNGGNLWTITAFDDASPVHTQMATQEICFEFIGVVGTHLRYRWRSTTFPDWNGFASQEGDQVFMHGDYAQNVGHDGIKWSIDTSRTGADHWTEWRETGFFGTTIVFANATFQRTGRTCLVTGPGLIPPYVPPQYGTDGKLVENPLGRPTPTAAQ